MTSQTLRGMLLSLALMGFSSTIGCVHMPTDGPATPLTIDQLKESQRAVTPIKSQGTVVRKQLTRDVVPISRVMKRQLAEQVTLACMVNQDHQRCQSAKDRAQRFKVDHPWLSHGHNRHESTTD